jgi:hypothetical protein
MPSQRRIKVFALMVVLTVFFTLYITGSARQTRNSDFYTKTQEALQAREYEKAAKQRDADDVGSRLKAAEEAAKKSADQKSQKYMDSISGGEKSVAGRVLMNQEGEGKVPGVAGVGGRPRDREAAKQPESEEEHEVEVELNAILKKSPSMLHINYPKITLMLHSHYLLQDLLSSLQTSQAYPSRPLQNRPCSLRGRTRRTPSRNSPSSQTRPEHWPENRTKCPHKWEEHWWRG